MNVLVNPLPKADLAEADRIFRMAFGTFLGLLRVFPQPLDRHKGNAERGAVR
jgi:hypothetical protein